MRSKDKTELVQAPQPSGKVDFLLLTKKGDGRTVLMKRVPKQHIRVSRSKHKSPHFFVKGSQRGRR